ncbi:MAG TPA: hypothetical protein DEO88_05015 [Syntrophobacteraceae bacterium]|nr:hypothetical protein [Syntrophobacteraceae bacterium]
MEHKRILAKVIRLAAVVTFCGATAGLAVHHEPFHSWYFCFTWWSYILFAQAWLYSRGGTALLFNNPGRFGRLLPMSCQIWLVFEAYNLRLHNWFYVGVPISLVARWGGYIISFATVLPAIVTTVSLIEYSGLIPRHKFTPLPSSRRWHPLMIAIGLSCLLLPLIWPRYFFPLVWGGFIFLLEPLNHRLSTDSLLRDWERGSPYRFIVLLSAGSLCGLMWEFWNYWAGTKWIYTIPYVHFLKLFEMPILGFLGFPPFAVECYVMEVSVRLAFAKMRDRLTYRQYISAWCVVAVLIALLDCWIFLAMDQHTVASYRD